MEAPRPPRAPEAEYPEIPHLDRASVILRIRLALQRRSGKPWSVTGGRGTAYGWITIASPARRRDPLERVSEEDRAELGELLGLEGRADPYGVAVPDSHDHYREYIDRAEGRAPRVNAQPYWD